jgi:hypothetical protein
MSCHTQGVLSSRRATASQLIAGLAAVGLATACAANPHGGTVAGSLRYGGRAISTQEAAASSITAIAVDGSTTEIAVEHGAFRVQLPAGTYTFKGYAAPNIPDGPRLDCHGVRDVVLSDAQTTFVDVVCGAAEPLGMPPLPDPAE